MLIASALFALLLLIGAASPAQAGDRTAGPAASRASVPVALTVSGREATIEPIPGTNRFRLRMLGTEGELTWLSGPPVRRTGFMSLSGLIGQWPRVFAGRPVEAGLVVTRGGRTMTYVITVTRPRFANEVAAFTIEATVSSQRLIPADADAVALSVDGVSAIIPRDARDQLRLPHSLVRFAVPRRPQPKAGSVDPTSTSAPGAPLTATTIQQPGMAVPIEPLSGFHVIPAPPAASGIVGAVPSGDEVTDEPVFVLLSLD